MTTHPRRKPNRLPAPSYLGQRFYFVTLCLSERKKLFTEPELVKALTEVLKNACETHAFTVHTYCFMPDHLHLVLCGMNNTASLPAVVRAFKGRATAAARRLGIMNLWQKGFYDYVIRSGDSFDRAAAYVLMNPVRAGLVRDFREWPYSGSFILDWKSIAPPEGSYVAPWKRTGANG